MKSSNALLPAGRIRKTCIIFSLAGALGFLYLRTFLLPATPLAAYGDEIHYFLHAVRMMHGQLPYRDFFTFVLPGTDVLYAAVFRLLGVRQWVAQALIVAVGWLLAVVITWVASKVLSGPLALLPGLLFLVFDFDSALDATHHWWSTLFVLLAVGVLLGGRSSRRVLAAGALCGVAALFTQTQGALGAMAIALYLVLTAGEEALRLRELVLLGAAFLVALGCGLGYFIWQVGLRAIAYWTIYFPAVYFSTLEAHTPGAYFLRMPTLHRPGDLLTMVPYLFIHAAVPWIYGLCLWRLVRERKIMDRQMWSRALLLTLVGLALFVSVMSAATVLRLCVIAPPAMILGVWFFSGTTQLDRWMRAALWTAGVVLLLYLPVSRQRYGGTALDMPTGRAAFGNARQYEAMQWLAERTHPGESIFDDPGAAFALRLESAGPLDYVTTGEFTRPEQVAAVVRALEQRRTRFVYLFPDLYATPRTGDNLGPFRDYLSNNYHLAKAAPSGQMWERN